MSVGEEMTEKGGYFNNDYEVRWLSPQVLWPNK